MRDRRHRAPAPRRGRSRPAAPAARDGQPVTLGLRPEHLTLGDNGLPAEIVVVEPTRRSLGTAAQIKKLANDIGLQRLYLVGNKVRNEEEEKFLWADTPGLPVLGFLHADLKVQEADRLGIPVYDHVSALQDSAYEIAVKLAAQQ